MPLWVHTRQQMFYAEILKSTVSKLRIIAHLKEGQDGFDIDHYIPDVIGYHPLMNKLIGNAHRIYVKDPPDLSCLTDSDILSHGHTYRYCVMMEKDYCPILLARLVMLKNIVVLELEHSDQDIMNKCKGYTVTTNRLTELQSMDAQDLRTLAEQLYSAYIVTDSNVPELKLHNQAEQLEIGEDEIPEDKYSKPQKAIVTKDEKGAQHLKLSPPNGAENLPALTIVTYLDKEVSLCQQMLLKRCWMDNRYPADKITWIIYQSTDKLPEWFNWARGAVYCNRDPETDYVVVWQAGYYYFPHSNYAKVKLLMDHPSVNVVGSHLVGELYIHDNQGYEWYERKDGLPSNDVVAYLKHRHPDPHHDGDISWDGWISSYMDMPFNYNCIKFNENENGTGTESRHKLAVAKLLSEEMKLFTNKLYRKLLR